MTTERKLSVDQRAARLGKQIDDAIYEAFAQANGGSMFDIVRQGDQDWRQLNKTGAITIHKLAMQDHKAWQRLDEKVGNGQSRMTFAWVARQYRNSFRTQLMS